MLFYRLLVKLWQYWFLLGAPSGLTIMLAFKLGSEFIRSFCECDENKATNIKTLKH